MNTRQQDIVVLMEQHGEITIKELAARLDVSEMTIHRDLEILQRQNFLYKKRGAAVFIENPDRSRRDFYEKEKREIGRTIASMLRPGESVLFDNSTTALECARAIDPEARFTFYTTSLQAAQILSKCSDSVIYCSGGFFFQDSKGFVGQQAEQFVENVSADVCVIGASGISLKNGITTPYPMHTALQKKIIAASKRRILGADHSKFGKNAMEHIGPLSDVDVIVTDSGISAELLEQYRREVPIEIAEKEN